MSELRNQPSTRLNNYLISANHANEMRTNYFDGQYQNLNPNDTRSVWYPIEVVEEYIAYLQQLKATYRDCDIDGVRIYFGAYGADEDPTRGYTERQTVFIMPTIPHDENGNKYQRHSSIYLCAQDDQIKKIDMEEFPEGGVKNGNTTLNNGHSYPPPPPM